MVGINAIPNPKRVVTVDHVRNQSEVISKGGQRT